MKRVATKSERGAAGWDPLLAVEFLTIARVRRFRLASVESMARAQAFYPLVGLCLAGLLLLVDLALRGVLPSGPLAAVLVAVLAIATRGLHLDGLADTFDGLLGGHDRERRLEIMRDPRLGSFGVTALVVTLLLKWSAIAALTGDARWPALLLAPVLARYAMVVTVAAFPYARADGLGSGFREGARGFSLAMASVTASVLTLAVLGLGGLILLGAAVLLALVAGAWARAAIGGGTGDVYGAVCELAETLVLIAALGMGTRGWLSPWPVGG